MFHPHATHDRTRRGLTLVELLVVLAILVVVTAATVPLMVGANQSRATREGARLVSTFISGARARAISSGRPFGVQIHRSVLGGNGSMDLSYVETPPPYAGDFIGSKIVLSSVSATGPDSWTASVGFPSGDAWANVVQRGDYLRLDFKGRLYKIASDPNTSPWTLECPGGDLRDTATAGVAFQIFRQPIKSSIGRLQLPEGAVIDIPYSGEGAGVFPGGGGSPPDIVLTFAPNGNIDLIYGSSNETHQPTAPIYLLIGKPEKIPSDPDPNEAGILTNYQDLSNRWVAVGPNGQVTTAENSRWLDIDLDGNEDSGETVSPGAAATGSALSEQLRVARSFAQSSQSMGGR